MGVCLSCLGLDRRGARGEEGETSRLLYDDPYRSQYGSAGQGNRRSVYQPDPESVRREREALEGICHTMSDNVIDVFTIQSQNTALVAPRLENSRSSRRDTQESLSPDEVRLRTIKKGGGGPLFSVLPKSLDGLKAVQDAIG